MVDFSWPDRRSRATIIPSRISALVFSAKIPDQQELSMPALNFGVKEVLSKPELMKSPRLFTSVSITLVRLKIEENLQT